MLISDKNKRIEDFIRTYIRFDLASNKPVYREEELMVNEEEIDAAMYEKVVSSFNSKEAVFYGSVELSDVKNVFKSELLFKRKYADDNNDYAIRLSFFKIVKLNGEILYHEDRENHTILLIDFYDIVSDENFDLIDIKFKETNENGYVILMSMQRSQENIIKKQYNLKNSNQKTILEEDLEVEKRNNYSGKITISSENFNTEKELFSDMARKMKRFAYSLDSGEIITE